MTVAGCDESNGDAPALQRAYFRVAEPNESGTSDIRVALEYSGTVSESVRDRVDGGEVLETEPTVKRVDEPLDWAAPYRASEDEIAEAVTNNTEFIQTDVEEKSIIDKIQSIIPDEMTVSLDLEDDRTVRGTIEDAIDYRTGRPLTGQRLTIPTIEYAGPTVDGVEVFVQFPDGFIYQLPLIQQSFPLDDQTYGLSLGLNDDTVSEVSFELTDALARGAVGYPASEAQSGMVTSPGESVAGTPQQFPLELPYRLGESTLLVPELTHRFDRTLSALQAAADRRRMAVGLAARRALNNAPAEINVHPRVQNVSLESEPSENIGDLFPYTSSTEGAIFQAAALSTAVGLGLVSGSAAVWLGATWLLELYGTYQTATSATDALDSAFAAVSNWGDQENAGEVFNGGAGAEIPPLDAVESMATFQADYATASLALADSDEIDAVIERYRRLLQTQYCGLDAVYAALMASQYYRVEEGLEKREEIAPYLRKQRDGGRCGDGIADELVLLDRFAVHVEEAATRSGAVTPSSLQRTTTGTPAGAPTPTAGDPGDPYVVDLDPRATFKRVDEGDEVPAPEPVALADLGVQPGDTLTLRTTGNYVIGPSNRERCTVIGVFSRSREVRERTRRERVPGAVNAGEDYTTVDTLNSGVPTDIPEDFLVSGSPDDLDKCRSRQTTVAVPNGAAYLFLAVEDDRYADNRGDISVSITIQ